MSAKQQPNMSNQRQLKKQEKKAHQCLICTKTFAFTSVLNCHIKMVHENLKPFKCETCQASFCNRCDLNRHIAGVHDKIKTI